MKPQLLAGHPGVLEGLRVSQEVAWTRDGEEYHMQPSKYTQEEQTFLCFKRNHSATKAFIVELRVADVLTWSQEKLVKEMIFMSVSRNKIHQTMRV
jgi:hypothetical protein